MTALQEAQTAVERLSVDERQALLEWMRETSSIEVAPGIFRTPGVCGGDACIRQKRLPVWLLEEGRRNGMTQEHFFESYPDLTPVDLAHAWDYVEANREEIDRKIRENIEA